MKIPEDKIDEKYKISDELMGLLRKTITKQATEALMEGYFPTTLYVCFRNEEMVKIIKEAVKTPVEIGVLPMCVIKFPEDVNNQEYAYEHGAKFEFVPVALFLTSTAWMSDNQEYERPSLDPNKKEVFMVNSWSFVQGVNSTITLINTVDDNSSLGEVVLNTSNDDKAIDNIIISFLRGYFLRTYQGMVN